MSVFISWSDADSVSHRFARLLQKWLPILTFSDKLECFVSSHSISSGAEWFSSLMEQLQAASVGVLCLTTESAPRPWMLFEAGALALRFRESPGAMWPLLIDLPPSQLDTPLSHLQTRMISRGDLERSKSDVRHLVISICEIHACEFKHQIFDNLWPGFEKELIATLDTPATISKEKPTRPDREVLEELVTLTREIAGKFANISATAPLQEFDIECPNCGSYSRVQLLDRPGETKPIICEKCSARFNAHVSSSHTAFTRLTSAPLPQFQNRLSDSVTVACPHCDADNKTEMVLKPGQTKDVTCSSCNSRFNIHMSLSAGLFTRPMNHNGASAVLDLPHATYSEKARYFLQKTDYWVPPQFLPHLLTLTLDADTRLRSRNSQSTASLRAEIQSAMQMQSIPKSTVARFVKVLFQGRAFNFGNIDHPTQHTPYVGDLSRDGLLTALARAFVRRLGNSDSPVRIENTEEIAEMLFESQIDNASRYVREAVIAQTAVGTDQTSPLTHGTSPADTEAEG